MSDKDRKDRLTFAIFWAMRERGVTPPKLAKAIGKSPDAVRSWRDGDSHPSALDVGPLAEALGVRADYFTSPPAIPEYPFARYALESQDPGILQYYRSLTGDASESEDAVRAATELALEDSQDAAEAPAPTAAARRGGRRRTQPA